MQLVGRRVRGGKGGEGDEEGEEEEKEVEEEEEEESVGFTDQKGSQSRMAAGPLFPLTTHCRLSDMTSRARRTAAA